MILNCNLIFNGYFSYANRSLTTNKSGVYCVYGATNNANGTISIKRLIYIGESENVRQRLQNHEKLEEWEKCLGYGEVLYFSCAEVNSIHRVRVEAALIYKHKPPVNVEYKYSFPFDTTTITTSGENYGLYQCFTVYKSLANAI